jgi:hypothetical protein
VIELPDEVEEVTKYRVATPDEMIARDWAADDVQTLLIGPGNFECCLGEPEDRTWDRDGSDVVSELNTQLTMLKACKIAMRLVIGTVNDVPWREVEGDDVMSYLGQAINIAKAEDAECQP